MGKNKRSATQDSTKLPEKPIDLTPTTVNSDIFSFLKDHALRSLPQDRYVILTFEDYKIKDVQPKWKNPNDKYKFPEYFIIFSIRKINQNLHQPIACVFWDRKNDNLVDLIKIYVYALHLAGLTVVCSICSDAPHFRSTVQKLTNVENFSICDRALTYSVGPVTEIVHLFDPPSLLKSLRNIFMYYKVEFVKEGTVKNADWEVIDYWNSVCNNNELEAMTHVALKDMNITQYAVKIFSRSVCAGIWDAVEQDKLHESAVGSAEFCAFFNDLFDSFNALTVQDDYTYYRFPVKKDSGHLEFWKEALPILDSIFFVAYANNPSEHANVAVTQAVCKEDAKENDAPPIETKNIVKKLKVRMKKSFKDLDDASQEKMLSSIKENLNTFLVENGSLIRENAKMQTLKKPVVTKFDTKTNQKMSITDEEKEEIIETFVRKIKKKNVTNGKAEQTNNGKLEKDKTYLVLKNSKLGIVQSYNKQNGKLNEEKPVKYSSPDRAIIDDPMGDIFDSPEKKNTTAAVDDKLDLFHFKDKQVPKSAAIENNPQKIPKPAMLNCDTKKFKAECVTFWILNVHGIKAITENLQAKRYKHMKTKNFNVDNVHAFISHLKLLNNIRNDLIHEIRNYNVIDKELALYCLAPKVSIILC